MHISKKCINAFFLFPPAFDFVVVATCENDNASAFSYLHHWRTWLFPHNILSGMLPNVVWLHDEHFCFSFSFIIILCIFYLNMEYMVFAPYSGIDI